MTLKEILDRVLRQSGASSEPAYATSTDDEILRLVDLANQSAEYFIDWPWQALRKRYEFTLTSAESYDLPDDFLAFVPDTMIAQDNVLPANFPTGPGQWAYLKSIGGPSDAIYNMRWFGDQLHIHEPDSGQDVAFEYLSSHPVLDADGITTQARFDADTDTFRLDDGLLIRDLMWRYKKLVGMQDWQVDLAEFKRYEAIKKGHDGGSKTFYPSNGDICPADPYYPLWRPVPNS